MKIYSVLHDTFGSMDLGKIIICQLIMCHLTHPSQHKMVTLSQTIFEVHFREWKMLYFDKNFTEVCSQRSIDNGPELF